MRGSLRQRSDRQCGKGAPAGTRILTTFIAARSSMRSGTPDGLLQIAIVGSFAVANVL
jgi:hypothetical protein